MTAQQSDLVVLNGDTYAIAGVMGGPLFDPATVAIKPAPISSACWRGYVCTYGVASDRLTLSTLELGLKSTLDGNQLTDGATVLGVPARPLQLEVEGRNGPELLTVSLIVKDLSVPVPFSGGLLLGSGFIRSHYVHMGYHPAWKYETVIEVLVRDGLVTDSVDRSAALAQLRSDIEAGRVSDPDGTKDDLRKWIARTFTLDYSRSQDPAP